MIKYCVRKIRLYTDKPFVYRYILHLIDFSSLSNPTFKVLVDNEYNKEVLFDSVLSATLYANLDKTLPEHQFVVWHPSGAFDDLCVRQLVDV